MAVMENENAKTTDIAKIVKKSRGRTISVLWRLANWGYIQKGEYGKYNAKTWKVKPHKRERIMHHVREKYGDDYK